MKLHFSVEYHTEWGQQVCVQITRHRKSGKDIVELLHLDTQDGYIWKGEIFYNNAESEIFTYLYIIYE